MAALTPPNQADRRKYGATEAEVTFRHSVIARGEPDNGVSLIWSGCPRHPPRPPPRTGPCSPIHVRLSADALTAEVGVVYLHRTPPGSR